MRRYGDGDIETEKWRRRYEKWDSDRSTDQVAMFSASGESSDSEYAPEVFLLS